MKERPILFSAPMVRAILRGEKTQTRRVVKPQPPEGVHCFGYINKNDFAPLFGFSGGLYTGPHPEIPFIKSPYGQVGDRLWVRETFSFGFGYQGLKPSIVPKEPYVKTYFWADGNPKDGDWTRPWPSIFMPRYFSRIDLVITGIRIERLQEISGDDARAEGCVKSVLGLYCGGRHNPNGAPTQHNTARAAYRSLWKSINGDASWDANPWVWVIEFEKVKP